MFAHFGGQCVEGQRYNLAEKTTPGVAFSATPFARDLIVVGLTQAKSGAQAGAAVVIRCS